MALPRGQSSLKEVLAKLDLRRRQRYIKEEYQAYGLQLASELNDWPHRALYIRLAKQLPRRLLEKARLFVRDQSPHRVRSRARLFMWKLKQLREEEEGKVESLSGK